MSHDIPFNRPYLTGNEQDYVAQAMQAAKLSGDGPFSRRCEALLAERFDARKVLLTTSCTTAMELSALLLDVQPGDEVILPSYTFPSTANAFALRGATLKFVDIRTDTLNLDEDLLAEAIGPRTRAIVPVHYAGIGCEMGPICALAQRSGAVVVEDAAQGVNATIDGAYLGTIGALGAYSFHESKNFVCGEGGALVINDEAYGERAEILREKGTNRSQFFRGMVDKYSWVDVGSSFLPADLLAAFLLAQLESMDAITALRERVWQRYRAGLAPLAAQGLLTLPTVPAHCRSNYHMFQILLADEPTRAALIAHLGAAGILAVFHYVPLHTAPVGQRMGYRAGMLPVTEELSQRLLRLPLYAGLGDGDVDRVVEAVHGFFRQHST